MRIDLTTHKNEVTGSIKDGKVVYEGKMIDLIITDPANGDREIDPAVDPERWLLFYAAHFRGPYLRGVVVD